MRREYRCYLEVHAGLGLIAGGRGSETLPPFASTVAETGPAVSSVERPNVVETGHVGQVANLPRTWLIGNLPHDALNVGRIGNPSYMPNPGLSLCYALAVFVLGVGVLAAWAWRTPGPQSLVPPAANDPVARDLAPAPMIARVTRIVGADWHDRTTVTADARSNRCVMLSEGLVELTYASGAKVTLVGPVLFSVDSANGGQLYRGKATVSTPKAADHPLFSLRCRTAVVTEQGNCEFGLEVDQSGASHLYVFRGNGEFRLPPRWAKSRILVLEPRDWLLSELGANGTYRIDFMKGRKLPEEFVAQWFKGITVASGGAKGGMPDRKDGPAAKKES